MSSPHDDLPRRLRPEQIEAIKEYVVDSLMAIDDSHDRARVRDTVDLYMRLFSEATRAVLPPPGSPREMTHDELVEHDFRVGLPSRVEGYCGYCGKDYVGEHVP